MEEIASLNAFLSSTRPSAPFSYNSITKQDLHNNYLTCIELVLFLLAPCSTLNQSSLKALKQSVCASPC